MPNLIKPFLVYLPYYLAWLLFAPLWVLVHTATLFHPRPKASRLCLEAGEGGWKIIEYQELHLSAQEYLGAGRVIKMVVNREESYVSQVWGAIRTHRPTHYAYSPRTGSQEVMRGLYESFMILLAMTFWRVIPIVFLTDLPVRLWRAQSAVVSALSGVVVTLMPPRLTRPIFPHSRMIGPYVMPFSKNTFDQLARSIKNRELAGEKRQEKPIFIGSLYEPRATKLNAIQLALNAKGIEFDIRGRVISGPRRSDTEYWNQLLSSSIVVTTADQLELPVSDWHWLPHFVYRYTEALACGALLVAPTLNGIDRYFLAGVHYVGFTSVEDAIEKIEYFHKNVSERNHIAIAGRQRVKSLVYSGSFWAGIDIALGPHSIT